MTKYLPLSKVIPLMLLYCIVTVIGMYHHELWFDEVQHFLIARDSKSIFDLASSNSYDVHVLLWKSILYGYIHFISDAPFGMQVIHMIIINIAVFVFLRYAPFNLVAKILIVFGYYFVFEYSLNCRNYALGLLFLFITCKLLSDPDKNLLWIGLLLILMCNSHLFFIFTSISIFLYLLYHYYERKNFGRRFVAFVVLFVVGLATSTAELFNLPADNFYFNPGLLKWLTVHNVSFAIHGIDKGFITFPPLHDPNFWNRHLFESWSSFIKVPISLLFLFYPVWVIRKSRKALIFYIVNALFLLLFLTMSQMTGSRYYGMFFIYFLCAIWLADLDGVNTLWVTKQQKLSPVRIAAISVFYVVLLIQLLSGIYVYRQDYYRPFSQGKNTVTYLRDHHLDQLPVVIDGFSAGAEISTYLKRKLYFIDADFFGGSCLAKKEYMESPRKPISMLLSQSKYVSTFPEFVLITNRDEGDQHIENETFSCEKLKSFQGGIIRSEDYHVYKVTKKTPTSLQR